MVSKMKKAKDLKPKKAWEYKLFKDHLKDLIAEGKTEKEKKEIEEGLCCALMGMNLKGIQGRK